MDYCYETTSNGFGKLFLAKAYQNSKLAILTSAPKPLFRTNSNDWSS